MKILQFKSTNIKRLKVVELALDDKKNLIMITGKNAQGKSSVIDSIWYALAGKSAMPEMPIRHGEESAEVELNLDGYLVKRTFTEKGTTLTVTNKDGSKYSNPQQFLDYILSNLSFDPLRFTKLKPKEQVDELSRSVGIDLLTIDRKKKDLVSERLMIGREMKAVSKYTPEQVEQAKKDCKEIEPLPSVQLAIEAYQAAQKLVSDYEWAIQKRKELDSQIEIAREQHVRLQAQRMQMGDAPKPTVDLVALKANIDTTQGKADILKNAQQVLRDETKVIEKKASYDSFTDQIEAVDKEKADKLATAKMPVEGLSWNEDMVLYKGIPYEQISSAEQLKVSMAIAMASNPKLRVIMIKDGSLLDHDNLKAIEALATDNDFQVWCEAVDDTGKVGIYIEDGEVKAIN